MVVQRLGVANMFHSISPVRFSFLFVRILAWVLPLAIQPVFGQNAWTGALEGLGKAMVEIGREGAENERMLELERQRAEIWAQQQRNLREQELAQQRQTAAALAAKKSKEEQVRQLEARLNGGTGSGFFVTDRGHIITNAHVVGDFLNVLIKDSLSSLYEARVIRVDKERDLALLVIDRKSKGLRIANSTSDLKGEEVFAVGYPMPGVQGQESKITNGIVSSLSGIQGLDSWMQISAAIQGGNSGGPLVTAKGDVVGVVVAQVNTLKVLERSGSILQNVNYAIKSELLLDFLNRSSITNVARSTTTRPLRAVDEETVMIFARDRPFSDSYVSKPNDARLRSAEEIELEDFGKLTAQSEPLQLRKFLDDYPRSIRSSDIRRKLLALEKSHWEKARLSGNAGWLFQFLGDFPDSAHASAARSQLLKLDDQTFLQASKADSPTSLGGYVKSFPSGKHMVVANQRINQLKDMSEWQKAAQADSESEFRQYLNNFPAGIYAVEAKTQLERISLSKSLPAKPTPPATTAQEQATPTTTLGVVTEIFPGYGYLVMNLLQGIGDGQSVRILTSSGNTLPGKVGRLLGDKASVIVSSGIGSIKTGDKVVK